ncbi:MAG: UDP-N-acetylglucosamine--N-acetylmuramyl-(pentapeptide) pyrophosphoryl-undecaprenol N-acetylglucosamine transferase, partial [Bacteroidota bacterium]
QPDVVVGVGGYASGPTLEMASRAGIPLLIQEQNSYAGITNKLLAKKVKKACVAYDSMERFFPAERIQYTGNPVRSDILDLTDKKGVALAHFGLKKGKKTILAFGGSLGAKTINEAFANSTQVLQNNDVQVLWQMGKLYQSTYGKCATAQLANVRAQTFIDRMDLAYAAADVIIGRAGALTISELCIVGKAAILVPSPNVAEDHQTKNAMALVKKKAAILIKDKDAEKQLLPSVLDLLSNEQEQLTLSTNIKQLAKPNAAKEIAQAVLKLGSN